MHRVSYHVWPTNLNIAMQLL